MGWPNQGWRRYSNNREMNFLQVWERQVVVAGSTYLELCLLCLTELGLGARRVVGFWPTLAEEEVLLAAG